MTLEWTRRQTLQAALGAGATALAAPTVNAEDAVPQKLPEPVESPFKFCFNTSTLRGNPLPLEEKIQAISKAGFRAIEPWIDEIEGYVKAGGTTADLRKRLNDLGLTVESAIGFAEWIVDDEARRKAGLEKARRDMDLLAEIGGKRIAAPPVGATEQTNLDLNQAAGRYRALLEIGVSAGVIPQVELWGFSKSVCRLGEVAYIAVESGHPSACMLLDVYHIYKGGSDFHGLEQLAGNRMHVLHINDYPASPPRATIGDADRVYPGDGVAPLGMILQTLKTNGFRGYLSLELFNRDLWQQDPLQVCRTGYAKMQGAVQAAFAG